MEYFTEGTDSKSLTALVLMVALSLVIPVISTPYGRSYFWTKTSYVPSTDSESGASHLSKNDGSTSEIRATSFDGPIKRYNRKKRDHEWFKFGHKVVGPLSKFRSSPFPGTKWVGFFFEESMAIVLVSKTNDLLECTLLELKKEEEQQDAMRMFGAIMELVPSSLQDQIQLNRACGQLPVVQSTMGRNDSSRASLTVAPGTKWCGMGDRATQYQELGENSDIDRCCRTHDNCPMKVSALSTKYGVTNFSFTTRSHCMCEEELYLCMKKANNTLANIGGNVYFNILDLQCLHEAGNISNESSSSFYQTNQLYQCQHLDRNNHCRQWKKNEINYDYEFIPFGKSY